MPTPPMLRSPQASADRRSSPDPLVALTVASLAVVAVGLLIAGTLAVYDWKTPGAEGPLVLWLAIVTVAVLILDLLLLGARYLRRLRLGL
ncbi:MAG: hypothetical protein JF887_10330 [Candidatus Dormibacteraeota bacterium]|uniref:Uncharacterized protein n=1 Tax=Candidatus Amunia macphersoniae TaxID=3127014 RepID=A0A934KI00_9BACT|nr:hypothetical protein [Candidatus Dormibacteraeota bacterium]